MGRRHQAVPAAFTAVHAAYAAALERAPLDGDTRRAYDSRVRTFLIWLEGSGLDGDPLTDAHDRDFAVRDYRTHMKTVLDRAANTVNAHLTALDHFFTQLGLGPAVVRRDDAPKLAPSSLDARHQKRYLRAVERRPLARDRAIGRLLFYSGLRIAELVALDDTDVPLSARKGKVIVRSGKGEASREVPLIDTTARTSVTEWRTERASWPGADSPALFLNRRGGRLTTRAVDQLMDELATDADIVVAEILGHARLDTTRRYTSSPPTPMSKTPSAISPPINWAPLSWANTIACTGLHESYRYPYERGLENQLGVLGLVLNCVVLWNTVYLDAAVRQLKAQGYPVRDEGMARLSPFVYKHLGVHGAYNFLLPDLAPGAIRDLRDPDASDDDEDDT